MGGERSRTRDPDVVGGRGDERRRQPLEPHVGQRPERRAGNRAGCHAAIAQHLFIESTPLRAAAGIRERQGRRAAARTDIDDDPGGRRDARS
jgi:hypothetical protein